MIRLLGAVEIEQEGKTRPYGARKYALLLALLALHPERIFSRSELVAILWPDSDEESGRAALRTALSALRHEMGEANLITTRETVAISSSLITTDVALLETEIRHIHRSETLIQSQEALISLQRLHRGSLLPGFYDDWVIARRDSIEKSVKSAMTHHEILSRTLERAGEKGWPPSEKQKNKMAMRLPSFATRFLGRETEIAALSTLLTDPRISLVSLLGTGGLGKTRLSIEIAKQLIHAFPGGVYFVPLVTCTTGDEIWGEIARSLGLEAAQESDWENVIIRYISIQGTNLSSVLLILDNMEQIVEQGAALMVRRFLEKAPNVTLLITSRQALGIGGERLFYLSGLTETTDQMLFLEHAQAVQPTFAITETNQEVVGEICIKLEGIPLAIELCAAWASVLTPEQILDKMDDRFALLKTRRYDLPERHRSLHATLEWGVPTDPGLLSFFLSLSVFRGGFTLEAVEAVGDKENALDYLALLQERSLLIAETKESNINSANSVISVMRYRLLETIREFAEEKLEKLLIEEQVSLQQRHLAYFYHLAETVTPRLLGKDAAIHFALLDEENPNFRTSIEFGLKDTVESVLLVRKMLVYLRWFWGIRGHRVPMQTWLEVIFARRNELDPVERAWLLLDYIDYSPPAESEALCREAQAIFESQNVPLGVAMCYENLGQICIQRGDFEGMDSYMRQAADAREAIGDIRGKGYVLAELAGSYYNHQQGEKARELWGQCRKISESLGDIGSLAVLDKAEASLLIDEGRDTEALLLLERALATFRIKGETWHIMDTLEHYGYASGRSLNPEDKERSRLALEEARSLAEQRGDRGRAENIEKKLKS